MHPVLQKPTNLAGSYYVDSVPAGSAIVIQVPDKAVNAVWGGLLATRAQSIGVKFTVVDGHHRDTQELQDMNYRVYSRGSSCLGAKTYTRVAAVSQPITISGVVV